MLLQKRYNYNIKEINVWCMGKLRELSDELNSIFDDIEINDMKCWGTAS